MKNPTQSILPAQVGTKSNSSRFFIQNFSRTFLIGVLLASFSPIASALTLSTSNLCSAPAAPILSNATIVGDGSPESCSEAAFKAALANGGAITFNCGATPHTISLSSQAMVNLEQDTLIDGNALITLNGAGNSRILNMDTGNFNNTSPTLTVMNLNFKDGRSSGTATALGTYYDGGGAAIYYVGGHIQVFDSIFENNHCDELGPDLAGGAIFGNGVGGATIVNSHFKGNHCANGGAIGNLWSSTYLYNSIVENNHTTGFGANYEGGEHGNGDGNQQGSGGNGGGIQMDGAENHMLLCGVLLQNNRANALGGGIFRTTYAGTGSMIIEKSTISGNVVSDQPDFSAAGGLFFMGGPISIRDTTFSHNAANIFGAIQLEDGNTTISLERVDITDNTARTGLAAVWLGDGVTGSISNSNISDNSAPGSGGFAAAFAGNGITSVSLSNSYILNNSAGNGYNPISCWGQFIEGGGNYQWPVLRSGEGSDDPDALCSESIIVGLPETAIVTASEPSPTPEPSNSPEPSSSPEPNNSPEPTSIPTATPIATTTPAPTTTPLAEPSSSPEPTPIVVAEDTNNSNTNTSNPNLDQFDEKLEQVFNGLDSTLAEYKDYCLNASQEPLKLQATLTHYQAYLGNFDELVLLSNTNLGSASPMSLPVLTNMTQQSEVTAASSLEFLQEQYKQSIDAVDYYLKSAVIRYRNYLLTGQFDKQALELSREHYQLYQSSIENLITLCEQLSSN